MKDKIDNISKLSKVNFKENNSFFNKLKKKQPKQFDYLMNNLHDEEFSKTNCLECANCCKTTSPIFTSKDISSISKHLRLKSDKFVSKYLIMDSDNDYVLKQSPCVFLNEDNSCFIYEYRPKACREYPHTNRKDFHKISKITMKNIEICPAAFNIVEKLKLKLNNNSQKFR
ncbi:YkgJ family cysteine cluster protein [Flavobacteriaceae bacterium]|nr:YkgJ family cysteine cluster protein [Flavobacteriaceae bacterium]